MLPVQRFKDSLVSAVPPGDKSVLRPKSLEEQGPPSLLQLSPASDALYAVWYLNVTNFREANQELLLRKPGNLYNKERLLQQKTAKNKCTGYAKTILNNEQLLGVPVKIHRNKQNQCNL